MSDLDIVIVREVLSSHLSCRTSIYNGECSVHTDCSNCSRRARFDEINDSLRFVLKFLDKQIPKRAVIVGHNNSINTDVGACPVCNGKLLRACDCSFCPDCGQRLDWS